NKFCGDGLIGLRYAVLATILYVQSLSPIMNNINDGISVAQGKGALAIEPGMASCIFLINRQSGASRTIALNAPTQVTHFLNAYQHNELLVVDACLSFLVRTENLEPAGELFPFNFPHIEQPAFSFPQLHRVAIDLTVESVTVQPIQVFGEFLRPNPKFQGIKHRYGYLAAVNPSRPAGAGMNSLAKYDFESGTVEYRCISEGYDMVPGEPIFVERPNATAEDDGWILQLWWNPVNNTSELVIFDAQDITKEPTARIQLSHHIPISFHGNWISWAQLGI
ncbi:carotenoid oxygenase family protein, partial [Pseudomonas helleri]